MLLLCLVNSRESHGNQRNKFPEYLKDGEVAAGLKVRGARVLRSRRFAELVFVCLHVRWCCMPIVGSDSLKVRERLCLFVLAFVFMCQSYEAAISRCASGLRSWRCASVAKLSIIGRNSLKVFRCVFNALVLACRSRNDSLKVCECVAKLEMRFQS